MQAARGRFFHRDACIPGDALQRREDDRTGGGVPGARGEHGARGDAVLPCVLQQVAAQFLRQADPAAALFRRVFEHPRCDGFDREQLQLVHAQARFRKGADKQLFPPAALHAGGVQQAGVFRPGDFYGADFAVRRLLAQVRAVAEVQVPVGG